MLRARVSSLRRLLAFVGVLILLAVSLTGASYQSREPSDKVRVYTRAIEFDFFDWTWDAAVFKFRQSSLAGAGYLPEAARTELVLEYFDLIHEAQRLEAGVEGIFSDPSIEAPESEAADRLAELGRIRARQAALQPLVEAVLEEQVSVVLDDLGLDLGGAPVPPVSFHFDRLPMALIVSPREVIRQEVNVPIERGLPTDKQAALEAQVERGLDVSALVVPVGGFGSYPTMVQENSSIVWITEVIVHEWIHNYLTLRPLGLLYDASPEMRTMNETAASLLGKEIGRRVLERYYPAFAPPPPAPVPEPAGPVEPAPEDPDRFDFRAEMRETRVHADELLAAGNIEEAEAYMEERRVLFWENGYAIRRLNQAYFAFYGAYADQPGGAAGQDPVGEAVRDFWRRVNDPVSFLRLMAWMRDFEDLKRALEGLPASP